MQVVMKYWQKVRILLSLSPWNVFRSIDPDIRVRLTFFRAIWGGEQNSTMLISQHVTPRGTTQGDGIDHHPDETTVLLGTCEYFTFHFSL